MSDPLENWMSLTTAVSDMGENECQVLLKREKAFKRRRMFMLRIHSRINKIRAERERTEIDRVAFPRGKI